MAQAKCPLCGQMHEIKLDKNKEPYVTCSGWRTNLWFRGDGEQYLQKRSDETRFKLGR